jgi:hypothetical protein
MLTRYAEENVKPVFDRLITELLASMPDDLVVSLIASPDHLECQLAQR